MKLNVGPIDQLDNDIPIFKNPVRGKTPDSIRDKHALGSKRKSDSQESARAMRIFLPRKENLRNSIAKPGDLTRRQRTLGNGRGAQLGKIGPLDIHQVVKSLCANSRIVAAKLRDQRLKMREIGRLNHRRENNDQQKRQNRRKPAAPSTVAKYWRMGLGRANVHI